jgi:plasmid replication initiation protein
MDGQLVSWQKQPQDGAVVWQHNRLAEARYELSPREQKLVLYVISMIEPDDENFKRYVVNISDFAKITKLSKNELYKELRELAENLKSKVLVIPNHFDAETGQHVDLVTSWFSDALITANGQGYFAVEISRNLKPYLLQVKREFFRFRLQHVMQMRSAYAMRLYQFAKRWEFRHKMEVSVTDLRQIMGAVQPVSRGKTKASLGLYADFKRRAVQPAVTEINEKCDLALSFTEVKAKGSKAIEALLLQHLDQSWGRQNGFRAFICVAADGIAFGRSRFPGRGALHRGDQDEVRLELGAKRKSARILSDEGSRLRRRKNHNRRSGEKVERC